MHRVRRMTRSAPPVGRPAIIKAMRSFGHRHTTHKAFSDFLLCAAVAMSNAVDAQHRDEREAQYMSVVKQYDADEVSVFARMHADLVHAFEPVPGQTEFADVLGSVFSELEIANHWAGQFFTPYSLSKAMAVMAMPAEELTETVARSGYVTVLDPAVGGGALLIAAAEAIHSAGINYQRCSHMAGVDVDIRAVHMAYIQLSLLGVPAMIVHGNSLTREVRSVWYTPMHVLGGWDARPPRFRYFHRDRGDQ
jgi:hypothetical protein